MFLMCENSGFCQHFRHEGMIETLLNSAVINFFCKICSYIDGPQQFVCWADLVTGCFALSRNRNKMIRYYLFEPSFDSGYSRDCNPSSISFDETLGCVITKSMMAFLLFPSAI